jgi:cytochrome P450
MHVSVCNEVFPIKLKYFAGKTRYMQRILFLQSDVQDPYFLYQEMLMDHPIYYDPATELWAVYTYDHCKALLNSPHAGIPAINRNNIEGLNEYAIMLSGKLARINNGLQHQIARETAIILFNYKKDTPISEMVSSLLAHLKDIPIDWVNIICRQLPVMVLLKGFGFSEENAACVMSNIKKLTRLMLPNKTMEDIIAINEMAKEVFDCLEKHLVSINGFLSGINSLSEKHNLPAREILQFCISNLAGILIQSYDAGRGILSNAMLQALKHHHSRARHSTDKEYFRQLVIETLRYDPPVQHTRRILTEDTIVANHKINKGQSVIVFLAAANRDPAKFANPDLFDINRSNNDEHLTFGSGLHTCIANHFSVYMAAETLSCVFEKYKTINLIEETIPYEPLSNLRLPKNIFISFNN